MPYAPAALILLLAASPAFAQAVYRWVDAEGVTHYSDNATSIPKGVAVFATDGEPISEMGKPAPAPVVAAARPQVEQAPGPSVDPAVPTSSEQYWRGQFRSAKDKIRSLEDEISADRRATEEVNGMAAGVGYSCWPGAVGYVVPQQQFGGSVVVTNKGVRAQVGGQVSQTAVVSPYSSCIQTINPEYERARHRLEKNRGALERAREELHELERRASFEAVPLEWRR